MKKGRTNFSFKKVSTRVAILALGVGLGISLLVSGGTFAKWTASVSQMTGANIQIGDWVAVEPPVISTEPRLPDANVGTEYRHQLEASFSEKATWSYQHVSGSLPTGMTLSREGVISGTPTYASTYTFRAIVKNIAGSDVRSFTLVTHPVAPVFGESQVLPDAFDGKGYPNTTLTASGQSKSYAITSGMLPKGLILHANGIIAGTPVGYGVFTFTVTVSNGGGSDSKEFTINLNSDFPYITTTALPDATKGVAYGQTIAGSGPSPTYSIVSGSLPAGMALGATTGRISGIPNTQGLSEFTVSKTNALGTVTQDLSIYVRYAAPTFTASYNPYTVRKNVAYSYQLVGTGEGVTYAITNGSLPEGITLNTTTGVISGTTSIVGNFDLTITKTNESGEATKSFTLTSLLVAPTLTFASWVDYGRVDSYFQLTPKFTGEEIVWSAPALPAGLSIDPSTGVISGIPTFAGNSYALITATNNGGSVSSNQFFIINAKLPEIATVSFPEGEVGESYLSEAVETGDAVTYSIVGTLPPGLTINANTGVLSGKPTKSGNYNVSLKATNSGGSVEKALTIAIKEDVPTITTSSVLSSAMQGVSSSQTIVGNGVNSKHTISAGTLPPGMTLQTANGSITGTPNASAHGAYTFTVTKANTRGAVSQEFTLNVVYQTPTLTSTAVSSATLGRAYSYALQGVGNGATYTVLNGALPEGIAISNTGVLSGAPTDEGTFVFTIQKTNESGTVSRAYQFKVNHVPPVIKSTFYDYATIGVPYSMQLQATGLDIVYSVSGTGFWGGISLDPNTGIISGTPTSTGRGYISVLATNSGGASSVNAIFAVNHVAPTIISTSLPNGMVKTPYSAKVETVGEGITFSASSLPSGLSINATTGVISGTPYTAAVTAVTISASNSGGTATFRTKLDVVPLPPTITIDSLSDGTIGQSYSQSMPGEGSNNTFSITDGALPPGLGFSIVNGNLTGKPSTRGTYTFTMTKTNVSGSVSKEFSLVILYNKPTFTTASTLTAGKTGSWYSTYIHGVGEAPTYTITEGELPPGISLSVDATLGRLTGTPTTPGNYSFTIRKSNLDGEVSRQFSINVTGTPMIASLSSEPPAGLLILRNFRE